MSGTDLLIIGRQVPTGFGGFIDLLALDAEGRVHVLELKRDRTPRDVVAQALDYGSWAKDLSLEELEQIYQDNGEGDTHLDEAFAEHFGGPLPDVVNAEQQFTIVASELDPASDRIIEFLAESYDVPINAVFFRHFADGGHEYLARTWLLDPHQVQDKAARPSRRKLRPWNGRDFYVILGRAEPGDPHWPIAHKYGFGNAGGGSWYWKPLRNLEPGHRVFAYVSGAGYVGIGHITGTVIPARDADVEIEGRPQPLLVQPDVSAAWKQDAASEDSRVTEMVVPVEWLAARPVEEAFWEKGLFASQVTACKLRDAHTIETVESAVGLNTELSELPWRADRLSPGGSDRVANLVLVSCEAFNHDPPCIPPLPNGSRICGLAFTLE